MKGYWLPILLMLQSVAWATETAPAAPQDLPRLDLRLAQVDTPLPAPAPAAVDLFADEPGGTPVTNPDADRLTSEGDLRRLRLTRHQILGTTTWGLMLLTSILGQLNYQDEYASNSHTGNYLVAHRIGTYLTTASFTAAGIYALIAPTPYKKPLRFDTALLHKTAVIGATAGMVAQVVLGFWTARQADAGNPAGLKDRMRIHQYVGWSTFGLLTVAQASWLF